MFVTCRCQHVLTVLLPTLVAAAIILIAGSDG
jgi:hypothetical protein